VPSYLYTGRDRSGAAVEARAEAPSPAALAAELIEAGVTPIRISTAAAPQGGEDPSPAASWRLPWTRPSVALDDLIAYARQMHKLMKAGIPIVRAICGLAEGTKNPALSTALRQVADALKSGHPLSDAMQQHPDIFSGLFINTLRIGENTGHIDEAFADMARYLAKDKETRRRISTATRYPRLVLGAIALALVLINVCVIPAFARSFESFGAELPWATRLLIGFSDATLAYWPHLLLATVGMVMMFRRWVATPAGQLAWDTWKLRIPKVGDLLRRATLARYAHAFAMSFNAGLPVHRSLQVVAAAVDNAFVCDRIHSMRASIERGETLTHAASHCGLFDAITLQMMAVGEDSGTIGEMHQEIANTYEDEVDYELGQVGDWLEPILIIAVGVVVLILALGVYMPLWELGRNAGGG
jgi:MSHA biogenesis protein MshG